MRLRLFLLLVAAALLAPGQQADSVPIEFVSQGARVHGRVFAATGTGLKPTVLMVPGWPGNPLDVAGLGAALPPLGVNMVMFNPRGMHESEGSFGFANAVADIGAALDWLARDDVRQRFHIDPEGITLGGYSFGGGMIMVYAAKNPNVRRLLSISGADISETISRIGSDPVAAQSIRNTMTSPGSVGRIADFDAELAAARKTVASYSLRDTAPAVAGRSILLVGGWEDSTVTVDRTVLPFYRALKQAKAQDVTFLVYHSDHRFLQVSGRLAADIKDWLTRKSPK